MRGCLDALYRVSGGLAALCLVAIAALVALQVAARLLDAALGALGIPVTGLVVPSLAEVAGFLLAAATFLALADTLAHGVHIRVDLLTARLPDALRRPLEAAVALLAAGLAGFAAYACAALAYKSYSYGDLSYGIVAVPLVIPQSALAIGLAILAVALVDRALSPARPAAETGAV